MIELKTFSAKVFFVVFITSSFARADFVAEADALYDKGDCQKALEVYNKASSLKLDAEVQDKILFRTSYCQFTQENYEASESGFKNYLKKYPDNDEARMKLAESLFFQKKYSSAQKVVTSVKAENLLSDVAILNARVSMESGDYKEATEILEKRLKDDEKNAQIHYWIGFALYQQDEDQLAEKEFSAAKNLSSDDSWVKDSSRSWLEQIQENQKKFHLQLTLGYLTDSNIDQAGNSLTAAAPGGGQQGPGGGPGNGNNGPPVLNKPTSNNYTSDTGIYGDLELSHATYSSRKLYLTTTLGLSSPFYNKNPSYDYSSADLDFTLKAISSSSFSYGASLKYANSWYGGYYYQDYVYLTPFATWSWPSSFWLKMSLPTTAYLNNKKITNVGPSADMTYEALSWLTLYFGYSLVKSTGPAAVIVDSPPPTLISGTMFSHYTTTGGYLTFTFYLPASFELGLTASKYQTNYELEQLPGNNSPPPRSDTTNGYQINLSKTLIKNFWSANLSYSYTDNKSSGFAGLVSNGSVSNYNYTRGYGLLTTTFNF